MAKRVPHIPQQWEEFFLCILFHMLLPLLPLAVELIITGTLSDKSLTLAAAMYSIALGITSQSKLFFGISIFVTICHSVGFGWLQNSANILSLNLKIAAMVSIGFMFLCHCLERYNRHVVDNVPFLDFNPSKG